MEKQPEPNAANSKRASKVPQATGQECQKSSAAWAWVPRVGGLHGSCATRGTLSGPPAARRFICLLPVTIYMLTF